MRPTLSLINREFTAYFLSPIAYVVLAVFLLVTGHLFYLTLNLLTESGPIFAQFVQRFPDLPDSRFARDILVKGIRLHFDTRTAHVVT